MRLCAENDNDAVLLLVSRDPIHPAHMDEFFRAFEQVRYGELLHVWRHERPVKRLVCLSPPLTANEYRWLRAIEICLPAGRRCEFLSRMEPVIMTMPDQHLQQTVWDA